MMQSVQEIINLYRQKRLRLTPERILIIELLHGDKSHPTMDEVHQRAKNHMPEIAKAIVYNTITELEIFGALKKLAFTNGSVPRYDTNTEPHDHLYCTDCHQVRDVDVDLSPLNTDLEKSSGFNIHKSRVISFGLCPDCQKS